MVFRLLFSLPAKSYTSHPESHVVRSRLSTGVRALHFYRGQISALSSLDHAYDAPTLHALSITSLYRTSELLSPSSLHLPRI